MTYTFTTKHGITRSFDDHNSFCRAFENQARVERLQELNKELSYEESAYGEPVTLMAGTFTDVTTATETQLPLELQSTTEER